MGVLCTLSDFALDYLAHKAIHAVAGVSYAPLSSASLVFCNTYDIPGIREPLYHSVHSVDFVLRM